MTYVEYIAPDGSVIQFTQEQDAPYFLVRIDGALSTRGNVVVTKSPGQYGVSTRDVVIDSRTVVVSGWVSGDTALQTWERREALAAALVTLPADIGEAPELGLLRVYRDGLPSLELECIPRDSPQDVFLAETTVAVDLEFFTPNPYWRETSESDQPLVNTGQTGITFPFSFPFEFVQPRIQLQVNNNGTVPAPVTMRMNGAFTTGRMINETTGKTIEVGATVAEGDYVLIKTAHGDKSVTLYRADGTSESIIHLVNRSKADFWHLRPGSNTIIFEANSLSTGSARLRWRQRYAGI